MGLGRVGLDGLPRPVHLEHGEKVIQYDRKTKWVEKNLLHQEKNHLANRWYFRRKNWIK